MEFEESITEATGKASRRTPVVNSDEESDSVIVPEKLANKGSTISAELMEERTLAERKSTTVTRPRSQNRRGL